MRDSKGFSLLELLLVLFLILFILLTAGFMAVDQVEKARGSMLTYSARTVRVAAETIIAEFTGSGEFFDDRTLEAGLTGAVDDDARFPAETRLSRRMAEYLAPHIIPTAEPGVDAMCLTFDIENGTIACLTLETVIGRKHYTLTVPSGGEAEVTVD